MDVDGMFMYIVRSVALLTHVEVIGAAPGSETTINWPEVWSRSDEKRAVKATLAEMKATLSQRPVDHDPTALDQFAAPFGVQMFAVVLRVFQQYWRTPSYLYSKTLLCVAVVSFVWQSFTDLGLTSIGTFHWFLLLGRSHFTTRHAKSDVRNLYASHSLWKSGSADHAAFRHSTSTI